jgi:tyrosyl-tRNA synthetase
VDRGELSGDGLDILEAFCRAGLAKSKSEARRCISQGGAYVNNHRVEDVEARLSTNDLASESVMVLRSGKKRYALLMFP